MSFVSGIGHRAVSSSIKFVFLTASRSLPVFAWNLSPSRFPSDCRGGWAEPPPSHCDTVWRLKHTIRTGNPSAKVLYKVRVYLFYLHMNTSCFLFVTFSRLTSHRSSGSLTSPKAPRPITFRISKSSLCSRMSFTVVVNGFTGTHRRAGVMSHARRGPH